MEDPMPIDLSAERAITPAEAARLVPPYRPRQPTHAPGQTTHVGRIMRWLLDGARAGDGSRVRLEALRLGGGWITTIQAVERFGVALAVAEAARRAPSTPPAPEPPRCAAAGREATR